MRQHIETISADCSTTLAVDIRRIDGPNIGTVVFAHGFCLNRRSLAPQAQAIARRFPGVRAITYDHRGHGTSSPAELSACTLDNLAVDLATVIDEHADGPVTLVGHSMGGMTALTYLGFPEAMRPAEIAGLVLIATSSGDLTSHGLGKLLATPGLDAAPRLAAAVPRRMLEAVADRLSAPVLHAAMKLGLCYRAAHDAADHAATSWALNDTSAVTKIGFLPALRHLDVRAVLPTITARTLVISGGQDALTPLPHSERMAAEIAHAEHAHYPDSGHMVHHEQSRSVADRIAALVGATLAERELCLI